MVDCNLTLIFEIGTTTLTLPPAVGARGVEGSEREGGGVEGSEREVEWRGA